MTNKYYTFLIIIFVFLLSMNGIDRSSNAWKWKKSIPEKQKLDSNRLNKLVKLIEEDNQFPDLDSILIIKNGYLVIEAYFNGFTASKIHTLQSVSKSFTSALVGIALNQGKFKSVNEKILNYFSLKKNIKHINKWKKEMTLKDLLTMRSGTDYHERGEGSPHFILNSLARGWDDFYLNRKMVRKPGTYFQYDSGAVILLSSMLKNRTGKHADEFAREHLFDPLHIKNEFWYKNMDGHPHTGGGLYLRPRDMAKLGLLYLQNGRWLGKQIIPEEWIKESFKKHVVFNKPRNNVIGYGYLWWIMKPDPFGTKKEYIYAAMGFRAQFIFIIPEHKMVIVVTGNTKSRYDQNKPVRFIYSHILPAIIRTP